MRTLDPVLQEKRKRQILEAAERCFEKSGFQGASIAQLCKEAKISPGHLYHYFPSKEAIIRDLTGAKLKQAAVFIKELMDDPDPISALVKKMEFTRAKEGLIFEMLAEAKHNEEIAEILVEHNREIRRLLAEFVSKAQQDGKMDKDLEPDHAAAILISIIDGAKAKAIRDPELSNTQRKEHLARLISRFLLPE